MSFYIEKNISIMLFRIQWKSDWEPLIYIIYTVLYYRSVVGTHLRDVINTLIPDSHETGTLLGLTTGIHVEITPKQLKK